MTIYERRHTNVEPINLWDNRLAMVIKIINLTDLQQQTAIDERAGRIKADLLTSIDFFETKSEELKLVPCSYESFQEFEVVDGEQIASALNRGGATENLCFEDEKTLELRGIDTSADFTVVTVAISLCD